MTIPALVKQKPISFAILGSFVYLVLKRIRRSLLKGPGEDIPWAPGWIPLLGHLFVFHKYMKDNNVLANGRLSLCEKAKGPDLFQVELLGAPMVVVTELEAIQEVFENEPMRFTKNFEKFPNWKLIVSIFGTGLFFAKTESDAWEIPHTVLKAPFSVRGVKSLMPLMIEQADSFVKCLKREVGYGGVCHIDRWVTKMAFETIAVCATGTSFGSFDDDQEAPFIKALNNMLYGHVPLVMCPAVLHPILYRKLLAQLRVDAKTVRDTCIDLLRRRREQETRTSSDKKDLLDMMVFDKDPRSGRSMTEEHIVDNILTFLFAGQDSTAAAMATMMCYLSANPRCKAKLINEIDDVVGGGELQWDQLSKLQYLDWCIKEALRLVPPVGAVIRMTNGEQILQNRWRVPDQTMILVGIMAIHYDKKIWGDDAHEFRPERWENGPPHKYAFIPFASGPRACTGREFTIIEQKITFVKLMQHFDFQRPENVKAQEGYKTLKKENQTMVPFIDMDVEFKKNSAFVGLFSAFELLERRK